jgi:isopenicillin N synthase-like dioxygenase
MSLTSSSTTTFPFPSDIPVADLHTVDFAELCRGSTIEARKANEAATGCGFFYLDQHGVDYDFMFDLASKVFALPLAEKMKYEMGITGHYFGYKRTGSLIVDEKGRPDQSEFYNISKDQVLRVSEQRSPQPDVVEQQELLLQQFMRRCHYIVEGSSELWANHWA